MGDESECTFAYQVTPREGYVFVVQTGYAASEPKVRSMQSDIESALRQARATRVVFDNRGTEAPAPWIRALMWSWLGSHSRLTRVALIQETDASRQRTMDRATRAWRGISMSWVDQLQIMAFLSERDAEAWICSEHVAKPA